jgi:glutaminyl-peptide cyclotransferase
MRALRALPLLLSVLQAAAYRPLSDASLQALPSPGSDYDIRSGALLAPILRVRKPGTPEIEQVRDHFVSFFKSHLPQWNIAFQNSTQPTALGRDIRFVNLIMTRDPPWASSTNVDRLTFAAHYDSKITPEGFIGAVDSAVPCAIMMHMARSLDTALSKKWADMQARKDPLMNWEKGVQMIFFDGEEAFVNWTDEDSLYGSRCVQGCLLYTC